MLQLVTIDINQILALGHGNPLVVMGRLFISGGFIPVIFVLIWGAARAWLLWRQNLFAAKQEHILLAIDVPKENEQLPKAVENIFSHVWGASSNIDFYEKWWVGKFQPYFGFEICSHGGYVQFYIRCQKRLRDLVESAVFSQYPDAEINEVEDYANQFAALTFPHEEMDMFGTEFTLKNESYLPIRTYLDFEEKLAGEFKDPMGILLESLSKIRPEEQIWVQIIAQPADNEWKKAGENYIKKVAGLEEAPKTSLSGQVIGYPLSISNEIIANIMGTEMLDAQKVDDSKKFKMLMLTPDTKSRLEGVAEKIGKSGFNSKIRFIYLAPKKVKNMGRVFATIKGSFNLFNSLNSNGLGLNVDVTTKEDYFWERWSVNSKKNTILYRYINRSGMGAHMSVMNTEELATLWHFPILTVKAPLLKKTESRRSEPPVSLPLTSFSPGNKEGDDGKPKPPGPAQPPTSLPFV